RPGADGVLSRMLTAARALFDRLEEWLNDLDQLAGFAHELTGAAEFLGQKVTASAETANAIQEVHLDVSWAPLMMPLRLWSAMETEVSPVLQRLDPVLDELRNSAMATRLRIALARLHTEMTGRFVVELIDGTRGSDQALPSIGLLCSALADGIDELGRQTESHAALADRATALIDEAAGVTQIPRDLMGSWYAGLAGRELPGRVQELSPRIADEIAASSEAIDTLQQLSRRTQDSLVRHDPAELRAQVEEVQRGADRLLGR
ncbi:MAG: hypothetical protein Q4F67_02045, partial [Propionibacteriaceae bacterium]|nr:hypothetical protein [Propionibacteriaceae bacterium]